MNLLDESAQNLHELDADQKLVFPEHEMISVQQSRKDETINSLMNKQEYDSV